MALSEKIYQSLKNKILDGSLVSGARLVETSLCEEYHLSRTPVREALQQLATEGLVENIENKGYSVLGISKQDYIDMFTLRQIYEVQAVEWAIERITDVEMEELKETFEFMEFYTMKNDNAKMNTINSKFHRQIYHATHNNRLQNLLGSYQDLLKYIDRQNVRSEDYLQKLFEEHSLIFKAFEDRDVEAGKKAMFNHIEASKQRYIER